MLDELLLINIVKVAFMVPVAIAGNVLFILSWRRQKLPFRMFFYASSDNERF